MGIITNFGQTPNPTSTPSIPAIDVKTSQMVHKMTCFHMSNTNTEGMELKWSICPTLINNFPFLHEQTVPFQFFFRVLKIERFSEDFIWYGKEFQTFEPRHLKLFVPNLTWFDFGIFTLSLYFSRVLDDSSFSSWKCILWN